MNADSTEEEEDFDEEIEKVGEEVELPQDI
jgi:hypothetical protein